MHARLHPLVHVGEALIVAVFDPHVDVGEARLREASHGIVTDLVRAAADLEGDPALQSGRDNSAGDVLRPLARAPAGRHEVVILEQEHFRALVEMELTHLLDHGGRRTQTPELAALGFVERPDAAEAAIPGTPAAPEHRSHWQLLAMIIDVRAIGQRQQIEIVKNRPERVDHNLAALTVGDAGNAAPVLAPAQLLHEFDQGPFALEADDEIGPGDSAQHLLGVKARIVSANGDMRSASRCAQGVNHSRKSGRHILEDQREPDDVGLEPFHERDDRLRVGRVGLDAAGETRLPRR